ncbi:MAG: glucose-6-phosphate dehydrogenase, partial [Bacteroidota bacterium]
FQQKVVFDNPHLKKDGLSEEKLKEFATMMEYIAVDTSKDEAFQELKERLTSIDNERGIGGNCMFYLSTPPSLYGPISKGLAGVGYNQEDKGWRRLIIEKPFGYSLATAQALNRELRECFEERQIYRIDHYLGKETVQNLFVTRFSNSIFEPLWNRNYIHRVEITSAESVGVEKRGGYYDGSGALRDMVQNHLLQLVALVAMEPPVRVDADGIRNEKLKLFQSLRPMSPEDIRSNVIRGQYINSKIRGDEVPGYREEEGVDPSSKTETFVAMKFFIDNWRWADVPFYIRSGKRLPTRVSEVVIHFKPNHLHLFGQSEMRNSQNMLVLRIQPDEGILMKIGLKIPGAGYHVKNVNLDFLYSSLTDAYVPEAYERLIMDAMNGDATLYARGDSAEAAWAFVDPILEAWKNDPDIPVFGYPAGTWGPEHVDDLIDGDNMIWRYPCKNLTDDGEYCEL